MEITMFQIVESWDWSGAGTQNGMRQGLARATWNCRNNQYTLTHGFSRNHVIQFLQQHITANEKGQCALIGIDFPFSFPFLAKGNHFLDGSTTWEIFSRTVHHTLQPNGVAAEFYGSPADYGLGGFADHFAHLYRGAGNIGPAYIESYRHTENLAHQINLPAASTFRLVNPMVGVQALAGICVLRIVMNWCATNRYPLTIWPLGRLNRDGRWHEGTDDWDWKDHGVVIVESYPRVSFHRSNVDRNHFGADQSIQQAIANLGVIPGTVANHVAPATQDERDALIVLLHLLSPSWFQIQVRPELPVRTVHLQGVNGQPSQPMNLVGPGTPIPLRQIEGNIFGL